VFLAAPPPPPAGHPSTIAFWNMERGLYARASSVSLTTDGGRTFRVVLRARRQITGMQAFSGRAAIVAIGNGDALRTLDGGRTWRPFRQAVDADYVTKDVGLGFRVTAFKLTLLATRNAGASWQRRPSPCGRQFGFSAVIDLVTQSVGWATCAGQPSAGQEPKAVFSTADGGHTWHRRGDLSWSGYVWGSSFARDGFGLVWESRGTLYVTRDGGDHWSAKPEIAAPEIDFGGGGSAFSGGRGIVFLGRGDRSARLLATKDYGRTWRVVRRWH
jgi:photosystem II stability/assembly factor-like uncharacterized protein